MELSEALSKLNFSTWTLGLEFAVQRDLRFTRYNNAVILAAGVKIKAWMR